MGAKRMTRLANGSLIWSRRFRGARRRNNELRRGQARDDKINKHADEQIAHQGEAGGAVLSSRGIRTFHQSVPSIIGARATPCKGRFM